MLAGARDLLGVGALLVVSAVASSSSFMPITPFIGVRISWLTLRRNADFMFDASTASSRALPVGAVELDQALQALPSLAREHRHQTEQRQRRERGDRRAVDLLGDQQRDSG